MSIAKSPAELIVDLTDQVRLLRQDVGNLTTTKAEAVKLMASVQKAAKDAFEQSERIGRWLRTCPAACTGTTWHPLRRPHTRCERRGDQIKARGHHRCA